MAIIPVLRDRDAPAAIDWLCDAFGFEKQLIVASGEGPIAHSGHTSWRGAQMTTEKQDMDYGGRGYSCLDCEG